MALFDKMMGKDDREKKLREEINSLELRKESVLSAIDDNITQLQRARSDVLQQAGMAAYHAWKEDGQVDLTDFWHKVQELDKNIAEQEIKKREMGMKYDEEIRLINSNLGINSAGNGRKCSKCGRMVREGDRFCQNCGTAI